MPADYNFLAILDGGEKRQTGWIDDPENVDYILGLLSSPVFAVTSRTITDTGKNKTVLLSDAVLKVYGKHIILKQTVGDCVSQGAAKAVDTLKCVQILTGKLEKFVNITATEVIYAGSRIEVSQGRFGRGDGSTGAAGARFVNKYGVLSRGTYSGIDLSNYSGKRARDWGMPGKGVPDELEPILTQHPVQTVSLIQSYEEARDAIANGYPVTVASRQGFKTTRDNKGCLQPYGQWAHQMCFTGVIDDGDPRLVCENSWGPDRGKPGGWVSGPRTFVVEGYGKVTIPEGSFCVRAEHSERMFRVRDSFAFSGFVGYPAQPEVRDYNFLKGA